MTLPWYGFESLELPGRAHIDVLNEVEDYADGNDDCGKVGDLDADEDHGAHEHERRVQEAPHVLRQHIVHHIHVLCESVDNPPLRCGVEEGHGTPHDGGEHDLVHGLAGVQGDDGEDHVEHEGGDGGAGAEGGVHAQVQVAVVGLARVAQLVVRPHLQPHIGAQRAQLEILYQYQLPYTYCVQYINISLSLQVYRYVPYLYRYYTFTRLIYEYLLEIAFEMSIWQ